MKKRATYTDATLRKVKQWKRWQSISKWLSITFLNEQIYLFIYIIYTEIQQSSA